MEDILNQIGETVGGVIDSAPVQLGLRLLAIYLIIRGPKLTSWSLAKMEIMSLLVGAAIYAVAWIVAWPPGSAHAFPHAKRTRVYWLRDGAGHDPVVQRRERSPHDHRTLRARSLDGPIHGRPDGAALRAGAGLRPCRHARQRVTWPRI